MELFCKVWINIGACSCRNSRQHTYQPICVHMSILRKSIHRKIFKIKIFDGSIRFRKYFFVQLPLNFDVTPTTLIALHEITATPHIVQQSTKIKLVHLIGLYFNITVTFLSFAPCKVIALNLLCFTILKKNYNSQCDKN